jgi:hypothetical protein
MVMNVISECECADCVKYGTFACEHMDSWNRYGDECDFRMRMCWFVTIDMLGGATMIGPSIEQGHPIGGTGRWCPPFSRMIFMFWNNLLMMIFY